MTSEQLNMFLHNINYDKFNIALGNTLLNPKFIDDKPFDAIVSNPPYSVKWIGKDDSTLVNDDRFAPAGVLAPNLFYGTSIAVNYLAQSIEHDAIMENDYNFSVSAYVEPEDTREKIDIVELNQEIKATVTKISKLCVGIDTIVAEIEGSSNG